MASSITGVSTHSRLKAAGSAHLSHSNIRRFNTQPPEGGWLRLCIRLGRIGGFNTQPPEGGWAVYRLGYLRLDGFNTQPPEGGWPIAEAMRDAAKVSTHSRLKAAGS